ncbi:vitamin K epoxide reductase family protein [Microbacterium sp. YY-01]|uniref:vitamin K epoxide reductase family protein n=1 Tax=Microbacterium sp. YY-01 TaxID=3421634 RepID=UPI003D180F97
MTAPRIRHPYFAVWLIVAGIIGWWAAFQLTIEKFVLLADPSSELGCDFSVLVQCGANLNSPQGAVFGFPNPIIGLTGWMAPIVVGAALLAGARFRRWFWLLFGVGMTGALAFVAWLIGQSIFVLNTLCPWCMVTWAVTIPTFFATMVHIFREGAVPISSSARRRAEKWMTWVPLMTIAGFAVIAVLAQIRLDWLAEIARLFA